MRREDRGRRLRLGADHRELRSRPDRETGTLSRPPAPAPFPLEPQLEEQPGTKWRGRDLVLAGVLGILLGSVAGLAVLVPLVAGDFEVSGALAGALVGIGVYSAVFATSWFFALVRRNASFADAWFRRVSLGVLLMMVPLSAGVILLNGAVVLLTRLVIGDVPTAGEMVLGEDAASLTSGAMIALFLFGAVAAPLVEEFFFRGLLYQYLRTKRGVLPAAVLSSLAFALAHFTPELIPPLFVLGLVLAWLVERYKSIYPAVAVHALNNGVVLLVVFSVAA